MYYKVILFPIIELVILNHISIPFTFLQLCTAIRFCYSDLCCVVLYLLLRFYILLVYICIYYNNNVL